MRLWLGSILGSVAITAAVGVGMVIVVGATYHPDLVVPAGVNGHCMRVQGELMRVRQGGEGPDVLLIHGGTGSIEDWQPVWDALTRRYRVTAYDRPGMGYSDARPDDATVAGNARGAEALVNALDLRDVLVVGHGYGATIALALAESGRLDARGYVLLAPRVYPSDAWIPTRANRLLAEPVVGEGLARLAGPFTAPSSIERRLQREADPALPPYPSNFVTLRQRLWSRPLPLATRARQRLHMNADLTRVASRLDAVQAPVVLLTGNADSPALRRQARRLAGAVPRLRSRSLPGVHHYIQFEAPSAVVSAVDRLRAGREPDPPFYSAGSTAVAASETPVPR